MKKSPHRNPPVRPVTPLQPNDLARVIGGQGIVPQSPSGIGTTPTGGV